MSPPVVAEGAFSCEVNWNSAWCGMLTIPVLICAIEAAFIKNSDFFSHDRTRQSIVRHSPTGLSSE